MLVATKSTAEKQWNIITSNYKTHCAIISHLLELDAETSHWGNDNPIEFSRESFLKNHDWNYPKIDPELVLESIDFEKGYIDDEATYDNYWSDESAAFGWEFSEDNPEEAILVYELGVGGPNFHILFFHKIIDHGDDWKPDIEYVKAEFHYHWWSPVYVLDVSNDDTAIACHDQIEEEIKDLFDTHYEQYKENKF